MRPLLLLLVLAGCATEAPLRTALPPLESRVPPTEPPPAPVQPVPEAAEAPPPAPVYLYTRTDEDLRLAYADGLAGLLHAPARADQARRVSPDEARVWLGFLADVNPTAAAFVRRQLGPVLGESALVAYVVPTSNPASCAQLRETLFVAVPERHQGDARPFVGLIARDACEGEALCLRCTSVGGITVDGQRPRVCTPAPC